MRPGSLVIFDCDGVLVDSEPLSCGVHADALSALGYPVTAQEVAERFLGLSGRDMRARIERELGRVLPHDYEARCAADLAVLLRRDLTPVSGIAGVIDEVRANGISICVASSSSPERIALSLAVAGLADRFGDHVFSSSLVPHGKPAPDLFLYAAAAMTVDPTGCIVVEDSPNGIRAARAAGMRAIGFTAGSHCRPDHADRLIEAGSHAICESADDLRAAIVSGAVGASSQV